MAGPIYTQPLGGPDNSNSVFGGIPEDVLPGHPDILTNIQDAGGGGEYTGEMPVDFSSVNEEGWLSQIAKWFNGGKGILDLMPGSDGKSIAAGLMIPSWLAAYKSWEDAGKYSDTAKEAMKYGDPFGQENRSYYQEMLKKSYEHPEEFLNDPGHQAKLKSGLDTVSRQNASQGYLGSGNMAADLAAYTTNLNNQFLSEERKSMMPLTGYQFDPSKAGEFLMKGNEQEIDAKTAALQALMMPFAMNMTENHLSNQSQGGNGQPGGSNGSGDGGPYGVKTPQNTSSAAGLIDAVNSGNKAVIDAAISKGIQWVKLPDGTMANLYAMAQSGYRTGEPDGMEYPTGSHGMPITESDPIQEGLQGGRNPDDPDFFYPTPGGGGLGNYTDEPMGPPVDSDSFWNFEDIGGGSIFEDLGEFYDP